MYCKIRFYDKNGLYTERWVHIESHKWSEVAKQAETFCMGYMLGRGCSAMIISMSEFKTKDMTVYALNQVTL